MNTTLQHQHPMASPLGHLFSQSSLTAAQITEVEALLSPLLWALSTQRQPTADISFKEAVLASLSARAHRRTKTRLELHSYTTRMLRYRDMAERPIRQIDIVYCNEMVNSVFCPSPHVRRKAQAVLHSIFAYAVRHGWCRHNPAEGIDLLPPQEQTIHPLTLPQIKRLLRVCCRPQLQSMEAAVRLMLWCGIRPAEVQRLHWGDIDKAEQLVYIDPRHSKTGGARAVPLRGGAKQLVHHRCDNDTPIAPPNWVKLWRAVRGAARLLPWQQDALRHTFASYHLKHFHNLALLQEEMGHRDSHLLRTRYLNLRNISKQAAADFFRYRE